MYKLIILDIDGTLLNKQGTISDYTLSVLQAVREKGIIVTICTGRNIKKTLPIAKKAGVTVPFACIDGTLLFDPMKKQVVEELSMNNNELKYVLDIANNKNLFIEVNDGYRYYKFAKNEALYQYDIFNKRTFLGRIKSFVGGVRYAKRLEELNVLPATIYQVVMAGDAGSVAGMKDMVRSHSDGRIDARDHLWENCLFISRQGVQKSLGMESLCRYFNVPSEQTIAIGDDLNDIDMIEKAGLGIAMGNAHDRVKAVADYITLSNLEDGAAKALAHFLL